MENSLMRSVNRVLFFGMGLLLSGSSCLWAQSWEEVVAAGKKEGKVVVAMSPSAELRKKMEAGFEKKYGIDLEISTGRGSSQVRKILDEYKAGVGSFDMMVGGTTSTTNLLGYKLLQPMGPFLINPDVADADQWWGGHRYADTAGKYIYSPLAYMAESLWYNKDQLEAGDIQSYKDLLDPKWKGKIGFHDPRRAGSGAGIWSYLWLKMGPEFLEQLVKQDLLVLPDRRQLAEAVAKGKVPIGLGAAYFSYLPFLRAGLPVTATIPTEGSQGSYGSGSLAIIKDHPHPNATKVFVNWLLSKEGQDAFTRAMGQATRRLDVETKWIKDIGIVAAKDSLTVKEFDERELSSQARIEEVRHPANRLAKKLLK